jgi:hypothetical protein
VQGAGAKSIKQRIGDVWELLEKRLGTFGSVWDHLGIIWDCLTGSTLFYTFPHFLSSLPFFRRIKKPQCWEGKPASIMRRGDGQGAGSR